jgi:hypothetical protein
MLDLSDNEGSHFQYDVQKWVDHYGQYSVGDLFEIMSGLTFKVDQGMACDLDKVKLVAIKRILKQ